VLLGCARLAVDDVEAALSALGESAEVDTPSVLLSRRQAVAEYARALLAAGRVEEAVATARRSAELPADDVRGRVVAARVLARCLAAAGELDEARAVATEAVQIAYATQQVSERSGADATLAAVSEATVGS
jgi:Flp pilus assembly protein TadD